MEKYSITPVWLDGRYGHHMLIPFKNKWDSLEDEELRPDQQEFMLPESYYRAIGEDFSFPEIIDLDGGPYMGIGYQFKDCEGTDVYRIDKFDCRGKYPILICSKLSS